MPYSRKHLEAIRHALCGEVSGAVPLALWGYRDLPADHPAFVAVNRLAALGLLTADTRAAGTEAEDVDFRPDQPATAEWARSILQRLTTRERPDDELGSRGEFCQRDWKMVQQDGWTAFDWTRNSTEDADGDGILDAEDALLFTPNEPIRFEIASAPRPPDRDGIPQTMRASVARAFDFCGPPGEPAQGFIADRGQRFDAERGFGWSRDLTTHYRKRHLLGGPRDSFVFTRQQDRWECTVDNATYRITLCVGDSGHGQREQFVAVEGKPVLKRETTARGEFAEKSIEVQVTDGRLTIDIGSGASQSNTCLNWLQIEPR